jgi:hypothetical protein
MIRETCGIPYREGTKVYPQEILKPLLRRVRRLEWRESDERFFRSGFRTAFGFRPIERRRAR